MSDLERLREFAEAATPGPWSWFGNVDVRQIYLATRDRGRLFIMGFKRWGMQRAQPEFRNDSECVMYPASELAIKEVDYRGDIADINNPDARFIAAADPTTVLALLDRIEELEDALHQKGHIVDIERTRFGLEHPVECRQAGLLNCPVDVALTAYSGPPRPPGRYPIELLENGELSFGEVLDG